MKPTVILAAIGAVLIIRGGLGFIQDYLDKTAPSE